MVKDVGQAAHGNRKMKVPGMSLLTQTRETTGESKTRSRLTLKVPDGARILIVSDDDSATERLSLISKKQGSSRNAQKALRRVARLRNPVGFRWSSRHPC